mmetsp:Transcript_22812/g.72389  ORF Transcript_22812/g.72389 Transcript_22812/m.72389 type:complete len:259 (-) Transcript_22812:406-1182(-)
MLLAKTSSNPRAEASPRNTSRSAESGMSRRVSMNSCWVLSRQPVPPRASSRTEERRPKPAKATVSGAPSSRLAAGVYSSERTRDVVTATTPSLALSIPISARTPGKYTILYGVRERSASMSAAVAEPPSRIPSRLLLPGRLSDTRGRGPRRGATAPFEAPARPPEPPTPTSASHAAASSSDAMLGTNVGVTSEAADSAAAAVAAFSAAAASSTARLSAASCAFRRRSISRAVSHARSASVAPNEPRSRPGSVAESRKT